MSHFGSRDGEGGKTSLILSFTYLSYFVYIEKIHVSFIVWKRKRQSRVEFLPSSFPIQTLQMSFQGHGWKERKYEKQLPTVQVWKLPRLALSLCKCQQRLRSEVIAQVGRDWAGAPLQGPVPRGMGPERRTWPPTPCPGKEIKHSVGAPPCPLPESKLWSAAKNLGWCFCFDKGASWVLECCLSAQRSILSYALRAALSAC